MRGRTSRSAPGPQTGDSETSPLCLKFSGPARTRSVLWLVTGAPPDETQQPTGGGQIVRKMSYSNPFDVPATSTPVNPFDALIAPASTPSEPSRPARKPLVLDDLVPAPSPVAPAVAAVTPSSPAVANLAFFQGTDRTGHGVVCTTDRCVAQPFARTLPTRVRRSRTRQEALQLMLQSTLSLPSSSTLRPNKRRRRNTNRRRSVRVLGQQLPLFLQGRGLVAGARCAARCAKGLGLRKADRRAPLPACLVLFPHKPARPLRPLPRMPRPPLHKRLCLVLPLLLLSRPLLRLRVPARVLRPLLLLS